MTKNLKIIPPQPAWLHIKGEHLHFKQAVLIIGATPKRWRILSEGSSPIRLPGHRRIRPGRSVLVPLFAISPRED